MRIEVIKTISALGGFTDVNTELSFVEDVDGPFTNTTLITTSN